MEQNIKALFRSTKVVGFLWIALVATSIIWGNEIDFPTLLLAHIAFFVLFAAGMLVFAIFTVRGNKETKLKNKLEQKKEWEEFQYDLYREERLEKQRYALIEKLDDKKEKNRLLIESINRLENKKSE